MAVELILKKPVPGLGNEADVVKVKNGYARNYLIPRDFAVLATAASKKIIEDLKKKRAEREAQELNDAEELAKKLNKLTLTFQMQSSGGGKKVFGSVTSQDVVERLATMGHELDKKKLVLPKQLRQIGKHEIEVDLPMGVKAKLKVVLEAPESEEASADSKKKASSKKKD